MHPIARYRAPTWRSGCRWASALVFQFWRVARSAAEGIPRPWVVWPSFPFLPDTVGAGPQGWERECEPQGAGADGVQALGFPDDRGALRGAEPIARMGSRKPLGFRRGEKLFPSRNSIIRVQKWVLQIFGEFPSRFHSFALMKTRDIEKVPVAILVRFSTGTQETDRQVFDLREVA